MLSVHAIPAAEAAVFSLGCAVIQAQRHRADRMTGILVVVALASLLEIVVLLTPVDHLNRAAIATAMADTGEGLPAQPR